MIFDTLLLLFNCMLDIITIKAYLLFQKKLFLLKTVFASSLDVDKGVKPRELLISIKSLLFQFRLNN